jgi:hypothetical protein
LILLRLGHALVVAIRIWRASVNAIDPTPPGGRNDAEIGVIGTGKRDLMTRPAPRGDIGRGRMGQAARALALGAAAFALASCAHHNNSEAVKTHGASDVAIGVNGYLWRATLDTLAFMPLASADPYGGVVITDWYANPEKPDERFKATVYILDTRLRADGLNVTIFRQVNNGGGWVDAPTSAQTSIDIENAILTRARQLRLSNLKG